jgi:cell division protein FtsB
MLLMAWIKRIVPFALALALGLFVASFFVSIAFPKMRFERQSRWKRHYEYNCPLRNERDNLRQMNEQLRRENKRLNNQLDEPRGYGYGSGNGRGLLIEPPPPPPVPREVIR